MGNPVKTHLVSNNSLPKLNRNQYNEIIDYLSKCTSSSRYTQPNLGDYIDEPLYKEIVSGLDLICASDDFKSLTHLYLRKADKKYVYQLEIYRETSALSSVRNVVKKLLLTSSDLKNLSGKRVRRGNEYCYSMLIDCSDAKYPSMGIHRLARLVCAFNEKDSILSGTSK